VLVAVRPSAVVVSIEQPHTSARNTWPATIVGLTLLTDRVRIDLDGEPSALVDVTPSAVSELELTSGRNVWLTAKATDLEVYGGDSSVDTGGPSSRTRRHTREDAVESGESGESVTSTDLAGRDRES
jgi:molybdopterin-binding protein